MSYETLNYRITKKDGDFEIRAYDDFMIMRVDKTSNAGFGTLFNYISGNNQKRQKINMTVPVLTDLSSQRYIAFTMPQKLIDDYPKAMDSTIDFELMKQKMYLSLTFHGHHRQAHKKNKELMAYAKDHGLTLIGDPILLRYNGPFTLPIFRHQDILYEIKGFYQ